MPETYSHDAWQMALQMSRNGLVLGGLAVLILGLLTIHSARTRYSKHIGQRRTKIEAVLLAAGITAAIAYQLTAPGP